MINKIPIIGWLLSILTSISLSLPFWLCWTKFGIGEKYFYQLPELYQSIPFWDCVWLFIVIGILKGTLIPSLAKINQSNEYKSGKE